MPLPTQHYFEYFQGGDCFRLGYLLSDKSRLYSHVTQLYSHHHAKNTYLYSMVLVCTYKVQWQSKEVNKVLGKMFMQDYNTVTLLYH